VVEAAKLRRLRLRHLWGDLDLGVELLFVGIMSCFKVPEQLPPKTNSSFPPSASVAAVPFRERRTA
jgi:hypothetical protein